MTEKYTIISHYVLSTWMCLELKEKAFLYDRHFCTYEWRISGRKQYVNMYSTPAADAKALGVGDLRQDSVFVVDNVRWRNVGERIVVGNSPSNDSGVGAAGMCFEPIGIVCNKWA